MESHPLKSLWSKKAEGCKAHVCDSQSCVLGPESVSIWGTTRCKTIVPSKAMVLFYTAQCHESLKLHCIPSKEWFILVCVIVFLIAWLSLEHITTDFGCPTSAVRFTLAVPTAHTPAFPLHAWNWRQRWGMRFIWGNKRYFQSNATRCLVSQSSLLT